MYLRCDQKYQNAKKNRKKANRRASPFCPQAKRCGLKNLDLNGLNLWSPNSIFSGLNGPTRRTMTHLTPLLNCKNIDFFWGVLDYPLNNYECF